MLSIENDDAPAKSCRVFAKAAKNLVSASFATNPTIAMRVDALAASADTASCKLSAMVALNGNVLSRLSGGATVVFGSNQGPAKYATRDCIEAVTRDLARRIDTWLTTAGNIPAAPAGRAPINYGAPLIGRVPWRSPFARLAQAAPAGPSPGSGASLLSIQAPSSCNTTLPAAVTSENDAPGRRVVCKAFEKGAQVLAALKLSVPTIAIRVNSIVMTPSGPWCEVQMTEGSGSTSHVTTKTATTPVASKSTADIAAQDCVWIVVEALSMDLATSLLHASNP